MSIPHWNMNTPTAKAVVNLINNMANSDFQAACGSNTIKTVIDFRMDIADTIWEAWFGRKMTEQESIEIKELIDTQLISDGWEVKI